jgi:hypothetical protein
MEPHKITIHNGTTFEPREEDRRPIYQALCSCGFGGVPMFTKKAAEDDGKTHVVAAKSDE